MSTLRGAYMQVPLNCFIGLLIIIILLSIGLMTYQIRLKRVEEELKIYHSLNSLSNLFNNHKKVTHKNANSPMSTKSTKYGMFTTICLALSKIACSTTIFTKKVIKTAIRNFSKVTNI